jgi:hypothetical protein
MESKGKGREFQCDIGEERMEREKYEETVREI